ncbi:hypothetical protein M441DRAFT_359758 [Trichoderma asperellum CBS 433.97]|uniref:Uncharacterized protein n=1 Tax=Trichoderma asperellum (strain ATCC 204424 / CBS 433.97 / NBRC 101777) TaxID=1042311 RepID=A0A2T3ZDF3_TRIA4|nr:hypothetical protein M441DRAFT_359758 [Trichoderma asperellum CBS 433.97]PTB42829.1 hypothetical protein M441DRAFT_359758 [Trichoderma asperellum CBS 433.97]
MPNSMTDVTQTADNNISNRLLLTPGLPLPSLTVSPFLFLHREARRGAAGKMTRHRMVMWEACVIPPFRCIFKKKKKKKEKLKTNVKKRTPVALAGLLTDYSQMRRRCL